MTDQLNDQRTKQIEQCFSQQDQSSAAFIGSDFYIGNKAKKNYITASKCNVFLKGPYKIKISPKTCEAQPYSRLESNET